MNVIKNSKKILYKRKTYPKTVEITIPDKSRLRCLLGINVVLLDYPEKELIPHYLNAPCQVIKGKNKGHEENYGFFFQCFKAENYESAEEKLATQPFLYFFPSFPIEIQLPKTYKNKY